MNGQKWRIVKNLLNNISLEAPFHTNIYNSFFFVSFSSNYKYFLFSFRFEIENCLIFFFVIFTSVVVVVVVPVNEWLVQCIKFLLLESFFRSLFNALIYIGIYFVFFLFCSLLLTCNRNKKKYTTNCSMKINCLFQIKLNSWTVTVDLIVKL